MTISASDPSISDESELIMHATSIVIEEKGVLILGASGSGKSTLALQLMAIGADLVADDQTCLSLQGIDVMASCPETIHGTIEARGVGLLNVRSVARARIVLVIDLSTVETDRLPPYRTYNLLGQSRPMLHKVRGPHFAAAILQYVKGGRSA